MACDRWVYPTGRQTGELRCARCHDFRAAHVGLPPLGGEKRCYLCIGEHAPNDAHPHTDCWCPICFPVLTPREVQE